MAEANLDNKKLKEHNISITIWTIISNTLNTIYI